MHIVFIVYEHVYQNMSWWQDPFNRIVEIVLCHCLVSQDNDNTPNFRNSWDLEWVIIQTGLTQ